MKWSEARNCLESIISRKGKKAPSGWYRVNCPVCTERGEPRPDTRQRGGFFISDEIMKYMCFRCGYSSMWKPGRPLVGKMKYILEKIGIDRDTLLKLSFMELDVSSFMKREYGIDWEERKLPAGSIPLIEANSPKALPVLEYVLERGIEGEYWWTPLKPNALLLPVRWDGKIIGYIIRNIRGDYPRYLNRIPRGAIFNLDTIKTRPKIIVVEGPFDALAIDGVAVLGNNVSEIQAKLLNSFGKEIIVVPDRERSGIGLVRSALKYGWKVAIIPSETCVIGVKKPRLCWENDCKDVAEAVRRYGRGYVLWSILHNSTNNPATINLLSRQVMGCGTIF